MWPGALGLYADEAYLFRHALDHHLKTRHLSFGTFRALRLVTPQKGSDPRARSCVLFEMGIPDKKSYHLIWVVTHE